MEETDSSSKDTGNCKDTDNGVVQLPGNQLRQLIQKAFEKKIAATNEKDTCIDPEILNYEDFFKHSSLQNVGEFKEEERITVQDKYPRIFANGLDNNITQTIEISTASTQMFSVTSEKSFSIGLNSCLGAAMCADVSMEGGLEYSCSEEKTWETSLCNQQKSNVDLIIPPKKSVAVNQDKIVITSKANCILKVKVPKDFTFKCIWLNGNIPSCEDLGIQLDNGKMSSNSLECYTSQLLTDRKEGKTYRSEQILKLDTFALVETPVYYPRKGGDTVDGPRLFKLPIVEDSELFKLPIVEDSGGGKDIRKFKQKVIEIKAKDVFCGENCFQVSTQKLCNNIRTITCYIKCEVTRKTVHYRTVYSQSDWSC